MQPPKPTEGRQVTIGRRSSLILAAAVVVGSFAVGLGAFFGGWALGERNAPEQALQTELAEKTYAVEDLEAAMASCDIQGVEVAEGAVFLVGAEHPATSRQCFIAEMGATELADREYTYAWNTSNSGGEYSWSNVHMVWEQTNEGRDLTITVSHS